MDWMMSARERIKMKRRRMRRKRTRAVQGERAAKETEARGKCGNAIHLSLPKQE